MSGHSRWHNIKHKKEAADKKRAKIFGKLSRAITVAAKHGGDPQSNMALKSAIEAAKEFSLSKENIEKAIKRGEGAMGQEEKLEQIIYEILGPEQTAIIVEAITDNRNRALGELRQIAEKYGGKVVEKGSLSWMFEQVGRVTVNFTENKMSKEELELKAIEAGAQNLFWQDKNLIIDVALPNLGQVRKNLEMAGIAAASARPEWAAKEEVKVKDAEKFERLFEELDENEAVQEIYSNVKLEPL